MRHNSRGICHASVIGIALLTFFAQSETLNSYEEAQADERTNDPVVARVYEHFGDGSRPFVLAVGSGHFAPAIWNRVKKLVAFRLHRHRTDGTTVADAAIYLVRDSDVYIKGAAVLRSRATHHEYVWCLLAAVLAHESAHTTPHTEREALMAEAEQLRRCLFGGHLYSGDGWNPLTYLGKVEAKLRNPREHY